LFEQGIRWIEQWIWTEEEGRFQKRIMPGFYDLLFDGLSGEEGYPAQTVSYVNLMSDLELTVNLEAGFLISGRVTDPDGSPLEGCWLNFYSANGVRPSSVVSGTDGEYAMRLAADDYKVQISPVKDYFPDSTYLALNLSADMTLDLVLSPGVRVYGKVTDSDGAALSGVMVRLTPHNSSSDGDIEPAFPSSDSYPGAASPGSLLLSSVKGLVDEEIPPPARADYSSQNDGKQNANGFSDGSEGVNNGRISPDIMPGPPYWDNQTFYARTDESGNWEVIVKAGVYDIYASADHFSHERYNSVFLEAVDCTSEETEVNITLEEAGIVIVGTVVDSDGNPVAGVLVSLYEPVTGKSISAVSDENGKFEIRIPIGIYELFAGNITINMDNIVTDTLAVRGDRSLDIKLGEGVLDGDNANSGAPENASLPKAFALAQNSPNPFNPSTTISYSVSEPSQVRVAVYDLRGRTVATLIDRWLDQGAYQVQWDGRNSRGNAVSSGVYFYRMEAGDFYRLRKMILLK
ncbi:MAG: carboxypeptidase regulatory-like domain-containing protein, partial [Gemmatimonadota bacterium]|nr:carboxypeptidase regulatory-like domain-containing protein [Gemmatimonadota bacterium]